MLITDRERFGKGMNAYFVIGQGISVLILIVSVVSTQFKEVKHILLGQIASNLLVALSYLFLGGISGAWVCLVAAFQAIVMYGINKREISERSRLWLMVFFALIYIAGTAIIYQSWRDLVTCGCALLYLMAIMQKNSSKYRRFMVANSSLWVIYDVATLAFVNLITHGMILISLIAAMIRLDWSKKNSDQRE